MEKLIVYVALVLFPLGLHAQQDLSSVDTSFVGKLVNEEHRIFLVINFKEQNIQIPGQEIYGDIDGYMGSTQCSHVWPIVYSKVDGNTAQIEMVNNYGSEDFTATLTYETDGTYTFRHVEGSTLKFPVNRKWQKIPLRVTFVRKEE